MLDIDPILMLSIAIIFLLVLARLNRTLFVPLVKHMDDREKTIKNDLANAQSNSENVDEMLEEASHVIAKAKKEASNTRDKVYSEAKQLADVKLAEAKENLEFKSMNFVKELEEEKIVLKESLISALPEFSEKVKAKISSI